MTETVLLLGDPATPVTGSLLERCPCEVQVRPREWGRFQGAWIETAEGRQVFGPTVPLREEQA
jgi:hypothetical protein